MKNKISKIFDSRSSFLGLPIVYRTIIFSLTAFVITIEVIRRHSELSPCATYECFNFMIEAFSFPIGILAATIPLLMLYAATHRSEQMKSQIEQMASQNALSNHYKHKEEFVKHCEKNSASTSLRIELPHSIHARLFPGSIKGDLSLDKDFVETIKRSWRQAIAKFFSMDGKSFDEMKDLCIDIEYLMTNVGHMLGISFNRHLFEKYSIDNLKKENPHALDLEGFLNFFQFQFGESFYILSYAWDFQMEAEFDGIIELEIRQQFVETDSLSQQSFYRVTLTDTHGNVARKPQFSGSEEVKFPRSSEKRMYFQTHEH